MTPRSHRFVAALPVKALLPGLKSKNPFSYRILASNVLLQIKSRSCQSCCQTCWQWEDLCSFLLRLSPKVNDFGKSGGKPLGARALSPATSTGSAGAVLTIFPLFLLPGPSFLFPCSSQQASSPWFAPQAAPSALADLRRCWESWEKRS